MSSEQANSPISSSMEENLSFPAKICNWQGGHGHSHVTSCRVRVALYQNIQSYSQIPNTILPSYHLIIVSKCRAIALYHSNNYNVLYTCLETVCNFARPSVSSVGQTTIFFYWPGWAQCNPVCLSSVRRAAELQEVICARFGRPSRLLQQLQA